MTAHKPLLCLLHSFFAIANPIIPHRRVCLLSRAFLPSLIAHLLFSPAPELGVGSSPRSTGHRRVMQPLRSRVRCAEDGQGPSDVVDLAGLAHQLCRCGIEAKAGRVLDEGHEVLAREAIPQADRRWRRGHGKTRGTFWVPQGSKTIYIVKYYERFEYVAMGFMLFQASSLSAENVPTNSQKTTRSHKRLQTSSNLCAFPVAHGRCLPSHRTRTSPNPWSHDASSWPVGGGSKILEL